MNKLPNCPCCDEDGLRIESYTLENGQWHYLVKCDYCNVEFHHQEFYGYNATMDYFEKHGRMACEDVGGDDEFRCSNCSYSHDYTPEELRNPQDFSYCPRCGSEVCR